MSSAAHLGPNIRDARLSAGLTQQQLAELIGVERSRVADYEHGRHRPSLARLEWIARATGAPGVGWFYDPHDN